MNDVAAAGGGGELDIAIVGMAGRFPGAQNIDEFWDNLKNGVESISFFSDEELQEAGVDPKLFKSPNYVRARGILNDVDLFDAAFFGFYPKEAELLDPQHRLFLECAWGAFEDAGYNIERYEGLVGVFGGIGMNSYILSYLASKNGQFNTAEGYQLSIGNEKDFVTTQVSYKLNLRGPSVNVQTACSTSLVAVYLAAQSLLSFQCDIALAGGATIMLPQKSGYYYQEGMILSPTGHCRAFDANANGTVPGNGVATVVLKRLEDALADGDHIYAVIKGIACNNDGSQRAGYTAPGVEGQAEVIASAQAIAGVEPETISYIETHGTGTTLGDPIEISALNQVFSEKTTQKNFCAIGSVKTNIGHLDTAAGVAGLIKTALSLYHKKIPPSLNFEKPNPRIDFDNSAFYVNTKLTDWHTTNGPRRAGVSSFGIGGTNVHAVLEEAPVVHGSEQARSNHLILLSARSPEALDRSAKNLSEFLNEKTETKMADLAYTLQVGRKTFTHRYAFVCDSAKDAARILERKDPQRLMVGSSEKESSEKPIVFMFSGQGAQYVNMGRGLYESEKVFRETVEYCSQILHPILGFEIKDIVYPAADQTEQAKERLNQTAITQPALFTIEYALAKLWMTWGISPQAMIGHSIGEYVAACLAGVFAPEDALKLVALRGALMQKMPGGAMLSLPLGESEVLELLPENLSLAAINGESLCVVSGAFEAIDEFEKELTSKGIDYKRLHTSHAFHSPMMDPILDQFKKEVEGIALNSPQIPYVSNVTGTWIKDSEALDPQYYATHLRHAVRFSPGIKELLKNQDYLFLEVGPGRTLETLARSHVKPGSNRVVLSSLHHPKEEISDLEYILNTLGRLWLSGVDIDWNGFYKDQARVRLSLPIYPFDKKRYWLDVKASLQGANSISAKEGKRPEIEDWFYLPSWKRMDLTQPIDELLSGMGEQNWLILGADDPLSESLQHKIAQLAKNVVFVQFADHYTKNDKAVFTINPDAKEDYSKLFEELKTLDLLPDKIVHLWNANTNTNAAKDEPLQRFKEKQKYAFYSLLFLVQSLAKVEASRAVRLEIVTSDLFDITGEEKITPEQATLIGQCIVIPQEFPNYQCQIVDIAKKNLEEEWMDHIAGLILAQTVKPVKEKIVACRNRHCWVQTFEHTAINPDAKPVLIREKGVYLITGGLGDIGFLLANYLHQQFRAKLTLVGRSQLPAAEEWAEWLQQHDESDPLYQKVARARSLQEQGAEFIVLAADVSDRQQMQNALAKVEDEFGSLNGVIHAAGVVGNDSVKTIYDIAFQDCETQFRAKVYGSLVLHEILRDKKIDFVLLQSSLSSVLGGMGFVAYSAANAFLDVFANLNNQKNGATWMSVNWDGWRFDKQDKQFSRGTGVDEFAISPEEGLKAFQAVFSQKGPSQIIVSTGDLQARLDKWTTMSSREPEGQKTAETRSGSYPRPNLTTPFVAPRNDLENDIASMWQDLLGIEEIGVHDNFFELGGHSLLATQLVSRLRDIYNVELPLRDLFESPTIATLAEHIEKEQAKGDKVDQVAEMLKMVEQLSDEEVKAILNDQNEEE